MKATEETKNKAKQLGITSWWVKGEETLLEEIANLDVPAREETPTQTVDSAEIVTVREEVEPQVDLIDLMQGYTWDQALMKIRMSGKKSKFYPFKEIIEQKVDLCQ